MFYSRYALAKTWPASVRPLLSAHGAPVGILAMERVGSDGRPYIPGDTGNASTWSVPVRYKMVPGFNGPTIFGPDAGELTSAVVQTAVELVHEGARMITSTCGYAIQYQEAVRAAVDVPVFLSSLLLVPFLEKFVPPNQALGVICASKPSLTTELLEATGLRTDIGKRVVVIGLDDAPAFASTWLRTEGELDVDAMEVDLIDTALTLQRKRPDLGMLLLECGDLPPYAATIQHATGVPVFDHTSLVEFFISGLTRKPFTGVL